MNQLHDGGEADAVDLRSGWSTEVVPMLDLQLTELIEAVWACERAWKLEDRIEAAIRMECYS